MPEVSGGFTPFDAITLLILLLSALMGVARGFRREIATFTAFTLAVIIATILQFNYGDWFEEKIPILANFNDFTSGLIVSAVLFLAFYVILSWIGGRLARLVQGLEDVGSLDRFGGALFGIARGIVALVFLTVLVRYFGVDDRLPSWIQESLSYPHLSNAAKAIQVQAPEIAEQVQSNLPAGDGASDPE